MEESSRNIQNLNYPETEENNGIASATTNEYWQSSNNFIYNPAAPPNPSAAASRPEIKEEEEDQIIIAANKIRTNNLDLQLEGLQFLRKLLSKVDDPPIDDVIKTNICQHIISLSYEKDDENFLLEAAWLFTNILSGNSQQACYLIKLGVMPFLFAMLKKNNYEVKEQVMWALGNVAGDSVVSRDMILNHENFSYIYEFLAEVNFSRKSMIRTLSWVVSNFIRFKPHPNSSKVVPLFPFLLKVILEVDDEEARIDASWGCSYLTDIDGNLKIFQNELFLQKMIGQLSCSNSGLIVSSLRTLGNIASSVADSFGILSRHGFLEKIDNLISNSKKDVRKEICWILSNICAEKKEAIEGFLEIKLYEKLLKVLREDCEAVQKEALWVLANTARVCDENQARRIAQLGLIGGMVYSLDTVKALQGVIIEGLTDFIDKDKNIISDEEKSWLIQKLVKMIEESEDSEKAMSLRLKLIDINNSNGK